MRKAFILRAKFNYLRFIKLIFKGERILKCFTHVEKRNQRNQREIALNGSRICHPYTNT